ncbi:TPA: restriction endonuclease subunit S [Corynebacterium striatum]|nr:restriction endonuclease subunit S [Corynebacterium striatum]
MPKNTQVSLGLLIGLESGQTLPSSAYVKSAEGATKVYGSNGTIGSTSLPPTHSGQQVTIGRVGSCGSISLTDDNPFITDNALVVRPRDPQQYHQRFFFYLLSFMDLGDLNTSTAQPLITANRVLQQKAPKLSVQSQRAIADYLDRETAEIDGMRADLNEMERLLTERRAAIISKALFNGDHEDGRTDRTSYLAPLWKFAEVSPPTPEFAELTEDDKVTFIPLEDIWPSYAAGDFQTVNWQPRLTGYTPFRRGDLLVPKVTPTVTHGRTMIANIATDVGVASTEVYALRARPGTNPRWMAHMLVGTEFLGLAGASVQGTGGLKRISTQFVESYLLPHITLDEQRRIADEIDRETAEIDSMLKDITKLRDLLAERRAAVISAAVTGQIDIPVSSTDKDEPHA